MRCDVEDDDFPQERNTLASYYYTTFTFSTYSETEKVFFSIAAAWPEPKTENGQIKIGIAKGAVTDSKRIDK